MSEPKPRFGDIYEDTDPFTRPPMRIMVIGVREDLGYDGAKNYWTIVVSGSGGFNLGQIDDWLLPHEEIWRRIE